MSVFINSKVKIVYFSVSPLSKLFQVERLEGRAANSVKPVNFMFRSCLKVVKREKVWLGGGINVLYYRVAPIQLYLT